MAVFSRKSPSFFRSGPATIFYFLSTLYFIFCPIFLLIWSCFWRLVGTNLFLKTQIFTKIHITGIVSLQPKAVMEATRCLPAFQILPLISWYEWCARTKDFWINTNIALHWFWITFIRSKTLCIIVHCPLIVQFNRSNVMTPLESISKVVPNTTECVLIPWWQHYFVIGPHCCFDFRSW